MTGGALADALVERGLDPAESASKASLFDLVLRAFAGTARRPPDHVWWVPGRLEVFGKHTDYAGGRTLVCAVPRGIALAAAGRGDGVIQIADALRGQDVTLQQSSEAAAFAGWRHYAEVVAHRLRRNFPGVSLGGDIVFASDLPRASGMSSSSALIVGLASALGRIGGIETRAEWRGNIRDSLDVAGYYACVENGLTFGTLVGDAGVGTHGGSEDHAAIIAARPAHLSAFSFVPMRHLESLRMPDDWRFVLAPCGVTSEKTGPAQAPYNRLAQGAQVLLDLWNAAGPRAASLGSALRAGRQGSAAAAAELRDLVRASAIDGWPADVLERRLDHFIREDARVAEAVEAFRAADAARVGRASDESQADAETLLGNQIPETIALARRARACGAFAACSFGAGFGGSVWALVDSSGAPEFAAAWQPTAFVAAPGPPVILLAPEGA